MSLGGIATGFSWDEGSQPVVHTAAFKALDVRPGGFDSHYTFEAESGAMSTRRVGSGRAEITMRIRFDRSAEHLVHMLRSRKGRSLTYWRRAPEIEAYPSRLVGFASRRVAIQGDSDRMGFGEYEVTLTLRAQSSSLSYEPLYSPWLLRYVAGQSIRTHTFARDPEALFVDGAGVYQSAANNILRSQHYVDGRPYALLERATTNLLTRSEAFDHADWTKGGDASVTANATTAPDGEQTADTFDAGSPSAGEIRQNFAVGGGEPEAAVSVHAKRGNNDWITVACRASSGTARAVVFFNLATGEKGAVQAAGSWTHVRSGIDALGNGWYRCWVVGSGGDTSYQLRVYPAPSDGTESIVGDGTIRLWGAQGEVSPVPTSYVKTTDSTAEREADGHHLLVDPRVGEGRSVYVAWLEQGTALLGTGSRYVHIGDSDNDNPRFSLERGTLDGRLRVRVQNAAGDQEFADPSATPASFGGRVKALAGWEVNDAGTQVRATLATRVEGGEWVTHAPSAWVALDFDRWSLEGGEDKARLWINSVGTSGRGIVALNRLAIFDSPLTPEQVERRAGV